MFVLILALVAPGAEDKSFVAPGSKLEKLWGEGEFTEGPVEGPDGGIYFSDIGNRIMRFDPKTGKTTAFRDPGGRSNGLKFDAQGRLIACEGANTGGGRRISITEKDGTVKTLADKFEGKRFNSPNDLTLDAKGRIYFSDPRYLGHEPIDQPVQAVYRIDTDGTIHRIITDAGKPNGVAVSPDQKTLYVVSNDNGTTGIGRLKSEGNKTLEPTKKGAMTLMAYDLAPDGSAKFRKTLVDYAPQDGPDGLVCDKAGNLYVAVRDETRPGIYVYSPEGKEIGYIKTEIPTNVGFGRGDAANVLYITAGKSLYRIKLNAEGYHLPPKK